MEKSGVLANLKDILKRLPWIFSSLKSVKRYFLHVIRFPKVFKDELVYFFNAREFVKNFDLVLVSGGGQIDDYWGGPWGHPFSLFKWGLVSKTIGAQYVFLGVGTCVLKSKLSLFFIRQSLKLASYRSYRDKTSKDLLKGIKFTSEDAVCPDLAWSYDRNVLAAYNRRNGNKKETIGISPITYLRENWAEKNIQAYENYTDNLASFVKSLIEEGHLITFFTTHIVDRNAADEIIKKIFKDISSKESESIRQVSTENLDDLFSCLVEVNCVIASRLHGVLISHLFEKPVLAISYDRKVCTHMKDMGFENFCFDFHHLNLDSLMSSFRKMLFDSEAILLKLKEKSIKNAHLLDNEYSKIF